MSGPYLVAITLWSLGVLGPLLWLFLWWYRRHRQRWDSLCRRCFIRVMSTPAKTRVDLCYPCSREGRRIWINP